MVVIDEKWLQSALAVYMSFHLFISTYCSVSFRHYLIVALETFCTWTASTVRNGKVKTATRSDIMDSCTSASAKDNAELSEAKTSCERPSVNVFFS